LTVSWFQNLFDARRKIAARQKEYNEDRPYCSLGYKTPKELQHRPQASTPPLSEGQGTQTPSLASGFPSRLKPAME
jgi:Integrase core domain